LIESNLQIIEDKHKVFKESGGKRVPDFIIEGTDQKLYTADFINLNKLRLTEIE